MKQYVEETWQCKHKIEGRHCPLCLDWQPILGSEGEYFQYLDDLRESGETNMLFGDEYLAEDFNLTEEEAYKIFIKWKKTFSERHPR